MAGRDATFPQRLRPHPRGVRGKTQGADLGDERGTQKSQGAACGHRSAGKADKKAAQAVGLYAPPPGGHGILDHRQTNRPVAEYREEALWGGSGNAGEKMRAIFATTRIIARYVLRLLENCVTISMNLGIEKAGLESLILALAELDFDG